MRGKVPEKNFPTGTVRITPAYAGKRSTEPDGNAANMDHPRLCGEKHLLVCMKQFVLGSPPPMRGKVNINMLVLVLNRITPAYAGKSFNPCIPNCIK